MDWGEELTQQGQQLTTVCRDESDLPRINAFLVAIRRAFLTP
jgi:hypothetical protein